MHIIVFVTTKNKSEAQRLATKLITQKLIACANIVSNVESHFWWQGKISKSREALLILKTRKSLFSKLEKEIKALHSYSVPEIIALDIIRANKSYLNWINNSVKG